METHTSTIKRLRRELGIAHLERTCRLVRGPSGRMEKSWRVPGTPESGNWGMLMARLHDAMRREA